MSKQTPSTDYQERLYSLLSIAASAIMSYLCSAK